ncbi:MAG: bifunctional adenosylcobinamide kinase/adenosylcobinamide-phosphate guanylyltransferase [Eubacteriales bacterium]|nr:bifunctional adenosylcobinamide kinase/adenosylcobinamide-phosphate guanylyltransferase [Eubacteriales bacterium]
MILLTGGSACGKSAFAESLCTSLPLPRYYIAAMKPYGAEGEERIRRHRTLRRGKGFETIEKYTALDELTLPGRGTALLECICNLTANEMFDDNSTFCDPCEAVIRGTMALAAQCNNLVVITNDVGADALDYNEGTRAYIKAMGSINAALAEKADTVCELVCGIPLVLKGTLPE